MKIAISTDGGSVSAHFGRCPTYTLVDIADGKVLKREEIPNPGHSPGFLPGYLSQRGVEMIIAGGMGPRAQGLFAEKGIQTLIGVQGPVDEVIDLYLQGRLRSGQDLCDHGSHHEGPCRHEQAPPSPGQPALSSGTIAVTAKGKDLDAEVDPRFGRAAYFVFVNLETGDFESFTNPFAGAAHGAGIQAAQFVAEKRPAALLTGQVGPNAAQVLEAAGVRVIAANGCSIREAVAEMKKS
ncbi:MAG: NifB/NifX family molybdenum-iron cluster-binding protein [Candidatus Aminicenantes bacterium]